MGGAVWEDSGAGGPKLPLPMLSARTMRHFDIVAIIRGVSSHHDLEDEKFMRDQEYGWAPALGAGVVVIIFLSLAITITEQWHWFESQAAAGWVQAIVAMVAVIAGAAGLFWQAGENRRLEIVRIKAEEARKLRIVGAALFHCRVAIEQIQDEPAYPAGEALNDLRAQLTELRAISPMEFPDWRALHGIVNAHGTLVRHFERIENADTVNTLRAVEDRKRYLNVVLHAVEFAEELISDALSERDSQLDNISMKLPEGRVVYSRGYPIRHG